MSLKCVAWRKLQYAELVSRGGLLAINAWIRFPSLIVGLRKRKFRFVIFVCAVSTQGADVIIFGRIILRAQISSLLLLITPHTPDQDTIENRPINETIVTLKCNIMKYLVFYQPKYRELKYPF